MKLHFNDGETKEFKYCDKIPGHAVKKEIKIGESEILVGYLFPYLGQNDDKHQDYPSKFGLRVLSYEEPT